VSASLREHVARARATLVAAGLTPADAAFDSDVLARHVLRWDRAQLVARGHESPPDGFATAFDHAVSRRVAREPVALITGHREFWGLDFLVTRDVLVPRPETELIIEEALSRTAAARPRTILDVGTGSGCLAIALSHEVPSARVLALDVSEAALAVAARNVERLDVSTRVQLVRANLLDAMTGWFDLIVSNPPYVPLRDAARLPRDVIEFEPWSALFAGEDGMAALDTLCRTAGARLAPGGLFIVEFGAGQDVALRLAARRGGLTIAIANDLAGLPRVATMWR
jgi:release factor glutamine methyltransferase